MANVLAETCEERCMPKIDIATVPVRKGCGYPPPYDAPCAARTRRRLGEAGGLRDFGINLLTLPPGAWSSQRHWHSHEDEFVYVLEGEVVLMTEAGEEVLRRGDAAGFKAGDPNGHSLQNRSGAPAVLLEVGSRSEDDRCDYPGLDMLTGKPGSGARFVHRDETPYPSVRASIGV